MDKRVFRLWTILVFVMAAAVFGVCAVGLWSSSADSCYASRSGSFSSEGDWYADSALDTLSTFSGTEGEAYLQIVGGYSLENPTRTADALALIIARNETESGAYADYQVLARSDDALKPGESVSDEYRYVSDKLDWYMEHTFCESYYPIYMELRRNNGQELLADWTVVEQRDDGSALILVRAETFSTPALAFRSCAWQIAAVLTLLFGAAAVTVLTAKKFLQ